MDIYIVGPHDVISPYQGSSFQRTLESDPVEIGEPILEPAGTVGRRGCVHLEVSPAGRTYVDQMIALDPRGDEVSVLDRFPSDWVYDSAL